MRNFPVVTGISAEKSFCGKQRQAILDQIMSVLDCRKITKSLIDRKLPRARRADCFSYAVTNPYSLHWNNVRIADLHVVICQVKARVSRARSGERANQQFQDVLRATVCLSASVPALGRTRHPFAVSGSEEPSPKIEFVFSAVPKQFVERLGRVISFAQSATCRPWQSAHFVHPVDFRQYFMLP
jgi:hypothetical protein